MNTTNETAGRQGMGNSGARSQTTDHLATKMHETVDRVAETARNAEQHIRSRVADLGDHARETEERALRTLESNWQKARSYVQDNPLMSAGIAFATGVILSSLLTRR
ncbi:MAG TPA: DUF883 C-terminal domain-containing protein [Gammaproteobacteria bacterium]